MTTNELSAATAPLTTDAAARTYLDQLMALVGIDGLVASLALPGLLADVDQHASAVRESLVSAGRAIVPLSLASYARSVLAVHERHGRALPDVTRIDWAEPEWTELRLVAVCALAEEHACL
jgi:hypothetical protein